MKKSKKLLTLCLIMSVLGTNTSAFGEEKSRPVYPAGCYELYVMCMKIAALGGCPGDCGAGLEKCTDRVNGKSNDQK
jgi:hypothetical protein